MRGITYYVTYRYHVESFDECPWVRIIFTVARSWLVVWDTMLRPETIDSDSDSDSDSANIVGVSEVSLVTRFSCRAAAAGSVQHSRSNMKLHLSLASDSLRNGCWICQYWRRIRPTDYHCSCRWSEESQLGLLLPVPYQAPKRALVFSTDLVD
jgi:hypothetical protein